MLFGHQYFSKKCHLRKQDLTPIWSDSLISGMALGRTSFTMDHIENGDSAIGMNGDALDKGVTGA